MDSIPEVSALGSSNLEASGRARGVASLVEQTARHLNNLCWTEDIQAAHWSALRYFAAAGSRARSVVGLSKYQGTNPGTASRTIAVLARKGLIEVSVDPNDKRSRIVTLTPVGRGLLERDPLRIVERIVASMPAEMQGALAAGLRDLLGGLLRVDAEMPVAGPEDGAGGPASDVPELV